MPMNTCQMPSISNIAAAKTMPPWAHACLAPLPVVLLILSFLRHLAPLCGSFPILMKQWAGPREKGRPAHSVSLRSTGLVPRPLSRRLGRLGRLLCRRLDVALPGGALVTRLPQHLAALLRGV